MTFPTATTIATEVAAGERSAAAVVDEHLARIDEREGDVHAFNEVLSDHARERAQDIDAAVAKGEQVGPLAGVPVAPPGTTLIAVLRNGTRLRADELDPQDLRSGDRLIVLRQD